MPESHASPNLAPAQPPENQAAQDRDEYSGSLRWKAPILCAVLAFILLAAWHVDLPGLYYDEVTQVAEVLRFVKDGAYRGVIHAGGRAEIVIRGHELPLMSLGYLGAVKAFAFVPVAATVRMGPKSIRYFTIAIGGLALLGLAAFALRLLGPAPAVLGIFLLAVDPSYIVFCRTDYGPIVFMMLLKSVALWQLIVWWQTRKISALYLAAFAMGLGVYDKPNFLWIIAALAAAAFILAPRFIARLKPQQVICAACLFLVGCLPLVVYNLSWPPQTLSALASQNRVAGRGETGPPHSFGELELRLEDRINVLADLFTAERVDWVRDRPNPRVVVMPAVALAAAIVTLICFAVPRLRHRWRREMFLLLMTCFVVLFAAATPGGNQPHHLILAYPYPQLLVAAVVVRSVRWLYGMKKPLSTLAGTAILLLGFAAPATASLLRYRQIMAALQRTGGTGDWSDSIYRLEPWLEANGPNQPVVAVDWGIEQPLSVLSQGRLRCVDMWYVHDAAPFQPYLDIPGTRYVLHAPEYTNFPESREIFLAAVRARGLQLQLVKTFTDRLGHPVFLVYVLKRTGNDAR